MSLQTPVAYKYFVFLKKTFIHSAAWRNNLDLLTLTFHKKTCHPIQIAQDDLLPDV
jgi:hypothetical protein